MHRRTNQRADRRTDETLITDKQYIHNAKIKLAYDLYADQHRCKGYMLSCTVMKQLHSALTLHGYATMITRPQHVKMKLLS